MFVLRRAGVVLLVFAVGLETGASAELNSPPQTIELRLQSRENGKPVERREQIDPHRIGVVAIDVWNYHWCKTAAARVGALVPRMNATLAGARKLGMQVFFCPTDSADKYVGTAPRERAAVWPRQPVPWGPEVTCPPVPGYGSGCMCGNPSCQGNYGWDAMHPDLVIDEGDLIPTDAEGLYSICKDKGITHLVVVGVHTQICVLGKPTGIRNMKRAGFQCILARDLTDALTGYVPQQKIIPDTSTAGIVAHFEEHLAPTINFWECMANAGVVDREQLVDPIRITPWGAVERPHFFEREQIVTLTSPWQDGAQIRYTLDGTQPTARSALYTEPLTLKETARLKAAGFRDDRQVALTTDCYFVRLPAMPMEPTVKLTELKPDWSAGPGHGHFDGGRRDVYRYERESLPAQTNLSNFGTPLSIRGKQYTSGLGVRAPHQMIYSLKPEYERFVALAGIDDQLIKSENGTNLARLPSVEFKVFIDGKLAAESPRMRISEGPWRFDVPIPAGSKQISLATTDAGDGNREDVADWVNVGFTLRPDAKQTAEVDFNRDIRSILSNNCFKCHGPDPKQRQAGLRLDLRESATKASESGATAIVPGDAAKSELVRRISTDDNDLRMPPLDSHKKLTAEQKALLARWIELGAEYKPHWAFVAPVRPQVPRVESSQFKVRIEIDAFIADRLRREGLSMSPEADKQALIRRVTFDLTGLPPTLAEIDAFLADESPEAYDTLVDRLLASPRYGEQMARYWLDAARYADTNGYQVDLARVMWPWRDWVIDAYNRNLPFDQFTIEQLAGDLLPDATRNQRLATGFNRNHCITVEGGIIDEEYRVEYVMDRVTTTATTWLGLTLGCCRCHDHKYDPFTQKEFYQLFAFFNRVAEKGHGEMGSGSAPKMAYWTDKQQQQLAKLDEQLAELKAQLERATSTEASEARTALERQRDDVQKQRGELEKQALQVMVMQEADQPRETFVLSRGQYDQPGEKVEPNVPAGLPPLAADTARNRLALAKWLVDPANPLTARVIVNRDWQRYFGTGLVKTVEDFGVQAEWPSHPELLDWLATEFIRSGWDIKYMQRLMVTSATYRQTSRVTPELLERDPENRLLARGPRFRLSAEQIRDAALAASGLLSLKTGGPSVNPYQPDGLWAELNDREGLSMKFEQSHGEDLYRRSLYTFWKRTVPPPTMQAFDAPEREYCVVRRSNTNTPLQALVLLNDIQMVEAARKLAERMLAEGGSSLDERLSFGFRLATARRPMEKELAALRRAWHEQHNELANDREAVARVLKVGESPANATLDSLELATCAHVARLILNLDETITKN